MTIDWDTIDKEIEEAAAETDSTLDAKISSLTRMKDAEVEALFPAKGDKQKLVKLMKIVNAAEQDNLKTAELVGNINDLAGTVVTLLSRFV